MRLRIGELAGLAGVTIKTVRHYERVGILAPPVRTAAGYRQYPAESVARLIRARRLAEYGVPLTRVRELIDLSDSTRELLDELERARSRIDGEVRALQMRRSALDAVIDAIRTGVAWRALLDAEPKGAPLLIRAEIRELFHLPVGPVGGCAVLQGTVRHGMTVHLIRADHDLGPATVVEMRHRKTPILEATTGMEIGILTDRSDIQVGDLFVAS